MRFQYVDIDQHRDTSLSLFQYSHWASSPEYPSYVKWRNLPFSILKREDHSIGLFTDSLTTFTENDEVGVAFAHRNSTNRFLFDYAKTNFASFISNSVTPNMYPELTSKGVVFKANQAIPPNTELTVDFNAIRAIFPNDPSVNVVIN